MSQLGPCWDHKPTSKACEQRSHTACVTAIEGYWPEQLCACDYIHAIECTLCEQLTDIFPSMSAAQWARSYVAARGSNQHNPRLVSPRTVHCENAREEKFTSPGCMLVT